MAVAQTIVVDVTGNGDYVSINDAVANADTGDTIQVMPGTYSENVKVDKQVNLIANRDSGAVIVHPTSLEDHTFHITTNNVTIDGFRIEKDDIPFDQWEGGIFLDSVRNVTLTNNIVAKHTHGIYLNFSNDNVLDNNSVSENMNGIYLHMSYDNTLKNNNMQSNFFNFGAYTFNGNLDNNIGVDNLVNGKPIYYLVNQSNIVLDSSSDCGTIYCIGCSNISIFNQTINDTTHGLFLYNSNNIILDNITITNSMMGVYSYRSSGILLNNNTILDSIWTSLFFMESKNNVITNNTLVNNDLGIYLYRSNDNLIYNNLFNNMINVESEESMNTWNTTLTNNTNIAGSLWSGGNVWSKPDETGFSQTSDDLDRNGISDAAYYIENDGVDELPISVSPHKFSIIYSLKSLVNKVLGMF